MKIYPGNISILTTDKPLKEDIVLGYITSDKVYKATFDSYIPSTGIKKVAPYKTFSNRECKLFKCLYKKESSNPNDYTEANIELKRMGDCYQYVPEAEISFVPERFTYSLIGKKTLTYNQTDIYNMKIGCIDKNNLLAQSLIQIFADAPTKGICPHNFYVNNQDLSMEALTTGTIQDKDLVFIQSPEGKYDKTNQEIPYEQYLSQHTNVWVCVENLKVNNSTKVNLVNPIIYNENISHSNYLFDKNTFQENYVPAPDSEISLFDNTSQIPIIIKHYKDKGFIIISTYDLIYYCQQTYKLIYEILAYIYFNSYIETETYTQWITDEMPDYIVKNNVLISENNFHSPKEYYKMLGFNYASQILLSKVNLRSTIDFTIANDYIIFNRPASAVQDPIKDSNYYSIYTERQNVIYVKDILYTIEEDIQAKSSIVCDEKYCKVIFDTFKYSSLGLDITGQHQPTLIIPLTEIINYKESNILSKTFMIYAVNNALFYKEYNKSDEGRDDILAILSIDRINSNFEIRDMRVRGGGLPLSEPSNYNLFDIAHHLGMPYRREGTIIFKLPEECKAYHDIICQTIEQHIAATKQYIIIYRKEE